MHKARCAPCLQPGRATTRAGSKPVLHFGAQRERAAGRSRGHGKEQKGPSQALDFSLKPNARPCPPPTAQTTKQLSETWPVAWLRSSPIACVRLPHRCAVVKSHALASASSHSSRPRVPVILRAGTASCAPTAGRAPCFSSGQAARGPRYASASRQVASSGMIFSSLPTASNTSSALLRCSFVCVAM